MNYRFYTNQHKYVLFQFDIYVCIAGAPLTIRLAMSLMSSGKQLKSLTQNSLGRYLHGTGFVSLGVLGRGCLLSGPLQLFDFLRAKSFFGPVGCAYLTASSYDRGFGFCLGSLNCTFEPWELYCTKSFNHICMFDHRNQTVSGKKIKNLLDFLFAVYFSSMKNYSCTLCNQNFSSDRSVCIRCQCKTFLILITSVARLHYNEVCS